MAPASFAKDGYIKNMELLAYHNLDEKDGGQMGIQKVGNRWYMYMSSRVPGWHVMEITDPTKPREIQFIKAPPNTTTSKLAIADGKMIAQIAGAVEGVLIYDVKTDPENPKQIGHWSTGEAAGSVHRFFYNGGRYMHLTSTAKGFTPARIYRIIDIQDVKHPVEVGRWWMQHQWLAGYTKAQREAYLNSTRSQTILVWGSVHGPPYVKGNMVYVGCGAEGMMILDISDITLPQKVGQLKHHPPFAGGLCGAWCHTILPMKDRPLAIMCSEGERFPLFTKEILKNWPVPEMQIFGMVDVSDPTNPTLIAMFPYPEVPEEYPFKNFNDMGIGAPGPFGPHNLHEPHGHPDLEDRQDRVYMAYCHAGLRVYDISDQFYIKEIAYYIPPNPVKPLHGNKRAQDDPTFDLHAWPRGPLVATAQDVIVDARGNIFLLGFHDGMWVLRCTV